MLRPLFVLMLVVSAGCGHPPVHVGPRAPDPTGCYVIIYDGIDFKGVGDMVNGPVRWASLEHLRSTNEENWRARIRSLRVGRAATVTAYTNGSFTGESRRFGPRTDHRQLDKAISGRIESLALTCQP